jgi:hypothetical protein
MENGSLVIDTSRFKWAARNLCEHAKYVNLFFCATIAPCL